MLQSGVSHCSLIFPASFSFFLTSVLKLFFRIKAKKRLMHIRLKNSDKRKSSRKQTLNLKDLVLMETNRPCQPTV